VPLFTSGGLGLGFGLGLKHLVLFTSLQNSHINNQRKSDQRDANTARPPQSPHRRTESAMAVVRQSQNFPPPQTPFPGAQDRQNLISWRRSLPASTDPVWWR